MCLVVIGIVIEYRYCSCNWYWEIVYVGEGAAYRVVPVSTGPKLIMTIYWFMCMVCIGAGAAYWVAPRSTGPKLMVAIAFCLLCLAGGAKWHVLVCMGGYVGVGKLYACGC